MRLQCLKVGEEVDRLADPWLERYIDVYMYIVIRGPQEHQSLTGEFDLYFKAERRDVLLQLNVHLCCVWRRFRSYHGQFPNPNNASQCNLLGI